MKTYKRTPDLPGYGTQTEPEYTTAKELKLVTDYIRSKIEAEREDTSDHRRDEHNIIETQSLRNAARLYADQKGR